MLKRYKSSFSSLDEQFAHKKGHSTVLCTALVKQIADHYISKGGAMFSCLLDATKAYPRLKYDKLFNILMEKDIPPLILRSIINMYVNQELKAEWSGKYSNELTASNGTKEGAILSSCLFCIYMDVLISRLKEAGYGCRIGSRYVGALSYAYDLILNSPTLSGLQKMINVCESFGIEYSVKFNETKTFCMKFSKCGTQPDTPVLLNGKSLKWTKKGKHLGNWLSSKNTDDDDINIKKGQLTASINKLANKFQSASIDVKQVLLRSYCSSFYGSQTWRFNSSSLCDISCIWNKGIRRLFLLPYMTHKYLLPSISGCYSLIQSVEQRFLSLLSNGLKSKNNLVNYMLKRALYNKEGYIGANVVLIQSKFKMGLPAIQSNKSYHIKNFYLLNEEQQATSDILTELLFNNDVPSFYQHELKDIVEYLCTS